ncbi:MAG TPA: hypothetical protein VFP60_10825 [Pseudolabrys sp.]|nr:hypothetical protein [Pseudolabrys sp.]
MARHWHHWHSHNGHHNHGHGRPDIPNMPEPDQPDTPTTPEPPPEGAQDFAALGAIFNDATRALVGGLWQNVIEEGGQGQGTVVQYVDDLQKVKSGIEELIAGDQFAGDTLTNAQAILADIDTAVSAAAASVTGGRTFGSVAAAEAALRDSHLDILNIVNGDPNLSALATKDGAVGFMPTPPTLDGVTAEDAPRTTLAEIGAIFDDASSRILGGVNSENKAIIRDDIRAVIDGMKELMADQPDVFSGLTGVHAETVVRQLELEFRYIKSAATDPDSGRGSNDNILDIIDIIQGDETLAAMANQNGVSGFTPFPDALNETPKYLDNEAQTVFWANFIADSNSLGQRAVELVGQGDKGAIRDLIQDLRTFESEVTQFDLAQGGIFGARFDNELLGKTSTLGAEVDSMIRGLKTGDAELVAAAAEVMHGNSADVGGNNLPITGGTYNPDGLTAEEVLGQPLPQVAQEQTVAPAGPTVEIASAQGPQDVRPQEHHFEHLWG